jgi:hypothetical protein
VEKDLLFKLFASNIAIVNKKKIFSCFFFKSFHMKGSFTLMKFFLAKKRGGAPFLDYDSTQIGAVMSPLVFPVQGIQGKFTICCFWELKKT